MCSVPGTLHIVEARVFQRTLAYLRGFLRGGFVDTFFEQDLPKIELTEDAIYHALYRDAPNMDDEISRPLTKAALEAFTSLDGRLAHWSNVAQALAFDLESGEGAIMAALAQQINALSNPPA